MAVDIVTQLETVLQIRRVTRIKVELFSFLFFFHKHILCDPSLDSHFKRVLMRHHNVCFIEKSEKLSLTCHFTPSYLEHLMR